MKGYISFLLLLLIGLVVVGGFAVITKTPSAFNFSSQGTKIFSQSQISAVEAGKQLSANKCLGKGSVKLTHLPMNENDFVYYIPYGLVTGNHVTPIDHAYFEPTDRTLPRDFYPVYAMADGRVTEIGKRVTDMRGMKKEEEFRLVFSHSCTFLTYYDLVTSLSGKVLEAYKEAGEPSFASVDVEVKAGEQIGKIGGQTLDFAVWDTERLLTNFITPELYKAEPWKIYTADPFPYMSKGVRGIIEGKNLRTAEPIAGRIDYDTPGKFIGNWFREDVGSYGGKLDTGNLDYWRSHLSIAPNHLDPTSFIFSIGDYRGHPKQLKIKELEPSPREVGVGSGIVKYELVDFDYVTGAGNSWKRNMLEKDLKIINEPYSNSTDCVLLEMPEERNLRMELFYGQSCDKVTSFTINVGIYVR